MCVQEDTDDFLKNQQFITRSAQADRASYFVTTYMKTETTWSNEKEIEIEKEKKKKKKRVNEKSKKEITLAMSNLMKQYHLWKRRPCCYVWEIERNAQ